MAKVNFSDSLLKGQLTDQVLKFCNCKLFLGDKTGLHNSNLWIFEGKIADPKKIFYDLKRKADIIVDCEGLVISPGFIDIQVNGAFRVDFSSLELTLSNIHDVAKGLLEYGVTAFCPTIISSRPDVYQRVLPLISEFLRRKENSSVAAVLGAHLEGPFISHEKCGCHPTENILPSFLDDSGSVEKRICFAYGDFSDESVALITLAPELPGAMEAISYLTKKRRIRVSLGHSKATHEIGKEALNAGATCVTHLFNAMNTFHHRRAGLIGLLADHYDDKHKNFYYGLIADGIHSSVEALRLAHSLNSAGLILVTDCISALGLNDGVFQLGNVQVEVKNMKATIKGSHVVAGSVANLPYCIQTFKEAVNCKLDEALQYATWKPACFLGVEYCRGSLNPGSRADFVLLGENANREVEVRATFVAGSQCFLRVK